MTVAHLPVRITRTDAVRLFQRRRFLNIFGLLRSRPIKRAPDGSPDSIELVWMPAYAIKLGLSRGTKRSSTWVSVDASFGGFALFEREGILKEGELVEERFPVILSPEAVECFARQGLLKYVLRRRGAKAVIEETQDSLLYYQPVWVYYYYRLGKKIDLAVLDGYAGSPMGTQVRIAIVNALIEKRKQAGVESSGDMIT